MKCIYLIKTSVLIICYFTLEYMTKTGCSYRILKFTFLSRVQWYSVHTSQLIHYIYIHTSSHHADFINRNVLFSRKLLNNGYFVQVLRSPSRIGLLI